jgi:ribosome-binding protein aMBF1 (putative translation factor)
MSCELCGGGDEWIKTCLTTEGSRLLVCDPCYWTCIGSVDCFRLRTVRGKESSATNKPDLSPGVSPRSYPAG